MHEKRNRMLNLHGTYAIMRKARMASAKTRATAKGIFGFSINLWVEAVDLGGGAD